MASKKNYTGQEKELITKAYLDLFRVLQNKNQIHTEQVRLAFELAAEAHKGIFRNSGEPYILHPIAVARILVEEMGLGITAAICGLLHDTVEDTAISHEELEQTFGTTVAYIVKGVTKINHAPSITKAEKQAENLKKMLLSLAADVRVIFIKLADRLHNMRTLGSMSVEQKIYISEETMKIYVPFAHRLGLYAIKSELEDLSFKYLQPEIFEHISQKIHSSQEKRIAFLNDFSKPLQEILDKNNLTFLISYRPKSIYGIFKKMQRNQCEFEEIYDVYGIRIVFEAAPENEKLECWKIYTLIAQIYQVHPERLRDWITQPRSNGYQALHTTVMSNVGKWVEIQIRSKKMDEIAELGAASHWRYKEDQDHVHFLDEKFNNWLEKSKEILNNNEKISSFELINNYKNTLLNAEITVFTPKGDPIILPRGATVLDFAFSIHSRLGEYCIGAKIDQRLGHIEQVLQEGNQVEIIVGEEAMVQENWLKKVISHKAKTHIKQLLRQKRKKFEELGKRKFQRYFKSKGLPISDQNIHVVLTYFSLHSLGELYYYVSQNKIDLSLLLQYVNKNKNIQLPVSKESTLYQQKYKLQFWLKEEIEIDFNFFEHLKQYKELILEQMQYLANEKKWILHFILPEQKLRSFLMELRKDDAVKILKYTQIS